MSRRAIRRLQETREATHRLNEGDDDEDEDDDVDLAVQKKRAPAFLAAFDDDDDDDDDDESSDENDSHEKSTDAGNKDDRDDKEPKEEFSEKELKNNGVPTKPPTVIQDDDEEEDLDMILAEFRSPPNDGGGDELTLANVGTASYFQIITDGMDLRDLDIEFVIRTTLSGNTSDAPVRRARRKQLNLFGNPRDDWIRPPHYVGGGIGMSTYDVSPRPIPWPYQNNQLQSNNNGWNDPSRWFRFQCSDNYIKDSKDYLKIQQSGDVNALALFLSHHPFVTDALLQLAMVLYQTNHNQEGQLLIRRTLWIYECSSLPGFTPQDGVTCLMDYHQLENSPFFLALFRLMQVSSIAGCMRTSLAVSRYLLALDPLRDPVGVLLILDCFALSCNTATHFKWLIDLIESRKVQVFHRDTTSSSEEPAEYQAELLDLPNFAFSYALAMFQLHELDDTSSSDVSWLERSNVALQKAIQTFPTIVEMLLDKNEVDLSGRSLLTDWKSLMPFLRGLSAAYATAEIDSVVDPEVRSITMRACDLMIRIFIDRNYKLWGKDSVLRWLYRNVDSLKSSFGISPEQQPIVMAPSPALMRYAPMDLEDYADRIRTLPPEANPLDPNLLVPALAMNANRRRFFQRNPRQQQAREAELEMQQQDQFAGQILIGGPPTNVIDPDIPLLELFWRSALPWNRVDGVLPPNR